MDTAVIPAPPLAQCPPERWAALRGVLTDIDDTLTHDARLEPAGLFIVIGVLFLLPTLIPAFQPMDVFVREIIRPAFDFTLRAAGVTP